MDIKVKMHMGENEPIEITMAEEDVDKIGRGSVLKFKTHLGKIAEVQLVDEKTSEILNRFPVIG